MTGSIESKTGLTRRKFLMTTAIAAGTAALAAGSVGCSSVDPDAPAPPPDDGGGQEAVGEKFFQSCMGNCSGWGCPLYVHVRDGKVVDLTKPNLKSPDGTLSPYQETCAKGYANIERMYSEKRVKYPMRRTGERGAGQWEQISWDEAIEEISSTWKRIQQEHGKEAVAFFSGSGSGMATISYTDRLKRLMGVMTLAPAYDNTGMYSQWAHAGFHPLVNGQNEHRDIANAERVFIWGANPSESLTTDFHFVTEAQAKGAKLIVIDPIFTISAGKADKFVPIRPATDGLLAVGMMQVVIRDGKIDKAHLQTATVAPFLVKDDDGLYLRLSDIGQAEADSDEDRILVFEGGAPLAFDAATDPEIEGSFEVEGIKVKTAYQILLERISVWDLDTIAEYTDIPLETIEELTELYTSGKSLILTGFGIDHYANGQCGYEAMFALADITGQECKHGCGVACSDFSSPSPQGIVNTATVGLDDFLPGPTIHAPHFHDLMEKGAIGSITVAPKSVYIYICNPIGNEPDRKKWLSSFDAMELIVVSDMVMSETAQYADIVLPVAFVFERSDLGASQNPFVKYVEKAVDPMFEAKGDFEIITELGRGMGFEDYFTQTLEEFLASCVTNETAAEAGITWERLQEEHAIWSYPEEPVVIGLTTPPFTATGRMEFYHEGVMPMGSYDQEWDMKKESCWYWEPPLEAWHENPLFEKYPLIFISERAKLKTHTMFNNLPMIMELDPEPYIKINPDDASARGIVQG
ncbi:MAG: molybdopterin-dependent oxidoreductase, partial [Coriobacteriales bacterium]|nr:molybdopterin-dependent oxidoreductase [Coriobacteriales bacterium]